MKREQVLRKRLHAQETLAEAVSAMKSLSAHHFRLARRALAPAREYRGGIDHVVGALEFSLPISQSGVPALLLIAADRGLCGSYSAQLTRKVLSEHARLEFKAIYCVGRRVVAPLRRAGLTATRLYASPASIAGITHLLLESGQDILGAYLDEKIASLDVIYARFEGVGSFTPVCTRVLPVPPVEKGPLMRAYDYVSPRHVAAVALREFLHSTLYEILIDALASEHGARLTATESAAEWLDGRIAATRRGLSAVRREASTQEVLDIASGARQRGRRRAQQSD